AGLHVGGAAPVEAVAVGLARKGVARPRRRSERDGVDVPGEAQRGLGVRAARPRDHAGAPFGVLVVVDAESPGLEQRAGVARAGALLPRRVDGVEAQQVPRQRDRVAIAGHARGGSGAGAPPGSGTRSTLRIIETSV